MLSQNKNACITHSDERSCDSVQSYCVSTGVCTLFVSICISHHDAYMCLTGLGPYFPLIECFYWVIFILELIALPKSYECSLGGMVGLVLIGFAIP